MSLTVPYSILADANAPDLASYRDAFSHRSDADFEVLLKTGRLSAAGLEDLIRAALNAGDKKVARAAESILLARSGRFDKPVPSFKALQGMLDAFLRSEMIDGWIYVTGQDDKLYPELVVSVSYDDGISFGRKGNPSVSINTVSYGLHRNGRTNAGSLGLRQNSHTFAAHEATNRRLPDILAGAGIYKETAALKQAHLDSMARHESLIRDAFSRQFRASGKLYELDEPNYRRRGEEVFERKVIHDLDAASRDAVVLHAESALFDAGPGLEDGPDRGASAARRTSRTKPADETDGGLGEVPEHPLVRVFDLKKHEFYWVHSDQLTPYVYDKSLRDKLVLPQTHRDLLDVLTSDLQAFAGDIIDGKSAGNVILCKGQPGVGKTLTAEVYAELIEKPLYAIHSGSLGTTAAQIEEHLQLVFDHSRRWGCVLLLDEADVFVAQRGNDIEKNAIVAEFLRTLEYFDGLLFMTTNRPDDIDEAIIQRCAAIIDYGTPSRADTAAIWAVMAAQNRVHLPKAMIHELVDLFPGIAPRDIKMLLRLALRVHASRGEALSVEIFRRCAMFRAIKMG